MLLPTTLFEIHKLKFQKTKTTFGLFSFNEVLLLSSLHPSIFQSHRASAYVIYMGRYRMEIIYYDHHDDKSEIIQC